MNATERYDLIENRKNWYIISGILILIGIASLVFNRLNVGVDFTGGRIIQYHSAQPIGSTSEVENIISRIDKQVEPSVPLKHSPVQLLAGRRDIILRTVDYSGKVKSEALSKKIRALRLAFYLEFNPLNADNLKFTDLTSKLTQERLDTAATDAGLEPGAAKLLSSSEIKGEDAQMKHYRARVAISGVSGDELKKVAETLYMKLDGDPQFLVEDKVDPQFGKELLKRALIAMAVAIGAILLYVTIRFEFWYAVAAIIALFHDVIITTGLYSLFRLTVDASFVAVVLTVFGYSINDTIIIFDRIRENLRKDKRADFQSLINRSLWETMPRSINTIVTVELCILSVIFLGGASVRDFAIGLFIGITFGGYSSIFVAAPLAYVFKSFEKSSNAAKAGAALPGGRKNHPLQQQQEKKAPKKPKDQPATAASNTPESSAAGTDAAQGQQKPKTGEKQPKRSRRR